MRVERTRYSVGDHVSWNSEAGRVSGSTPTHMIGGYAQLSYSFNYGTVGSNRDEFVIVRKLNEIKWLDHSNPVDPAHQQEPAQ